MKLLNIGCGSVFHSDWINLDKLPLSSDVKPYDICDRLPFVDAEIDACYSSHVLEHLSPEEAQRFLTDCHRILKSGSVIRLVVPDLEMIARLYLQYLEESRLGNSSVEANYDWMVLELYDQSIRKFPGGEMQHFLLNPHLSNRDFILSRIGQEAKNFWEMDLTQVSVGERLKNKSIQQIIQWLRIKLAQFLVRLIAGKAAQAAFQEGIFRQSGELHQWMYDQFSLKRLLSDIGFVDIRLCQAHESRIPNFNDYQLDIINQTIRKPDSLFMEGIKP